MKARIFNIQKFSINDGPGIRTAVFFMSCPLSCRWCSNPESQNRFSEAVLALADQELIGWEYTVEEVMEEVLKDKPFYDKSGGGMTLTGGEVLQQADFAALLADAARKENIHVAVETCGHASSRLFLDFISHVDLLLYDFKHIDRQKHFEGTGVYNDLILENLRLAVSSGKPVIARLPVIPGFNDSLEDAAAMAKALKDLQVKTVHLLPFHQFGENKYKKLGVDYDMAGVAQLHPEALTAYQDEFVSAGLDCSFQ